MNEFQLVIWSPDLAAHTTWKIKIHNSCNLLLYERGQRAYFGKDPMWMSLSSETLKLFEGKIWSTTTFHLHQSAWSFLTGLRNSVVFVCICLCVQVTSEITCTYICVCVCVPSVRGWSIPWAFVSSRLSDYACLLQRQINPVNKSNPWPMAIALSLYVCAIFLLLRNHSSLVIHLCTLAKQRGYGILISSGRYLSPFDGRQQQLPSLAMSYATE